MSGRGRGRGRQQGRGPGRGKGKESEKSKKEAKFAIPGHNNNKQYASFATILDKLANYCQANYDDVGYEVGHSIRNLEAFDYTKNKPSLVVATTSSTDQKDIDETAKHNKENELLFIEEGKIYVATKTKFENKMKAAYALIMQSYVTDELKHKIKSQSDYESDIMDNPVKLLLRIQELTHETDESRYPYAVVVETINRMLKLRQNDNESLTDYLTRFKSQQHVLKAQLGTNFLDYMVENTAEYKNIAASTPQAKTDAQQMMKKEAFNRTFAYIFVRNSSREKYGDLKKQLISQFSFGTNQYPATLESAVNILEQHPIDNKKKIVPKQDKQDKEDDAISTASFAQTGMKPDEYCYCCGSREHKANNCPKKATTAKKDWYINRLAAIHHQYSTRDGDSAAAGDNDSIVSAITNASTNPFQMSNFHFSLMNKTKTTLQDRFILDTGSTLSLIGNKELVTNIRDTTSPTQIATNGGVMTTTQQATIPGFGTVQFHDNAIANIIGFADLTKTHRIKYDSALGDVFYAKNKETGTVICFKRNSDGLYECEPSAAYMRQVKQANFSALQTVENNIDGFTKAQVSRAQRARSLYFAIGCPNEAQFKAILQSNFIKDCPVTQQDVELAAKIFGISTSVLKGKSTRRTPPAVVDDGVTIPPELIRNNNKLDICIDVISINQITMLTTIDTVVKYRALFILNNKTASTFVACLSNLLQRYRKAGFCPQFIHGDDEFESAFAQLKQQDNNIDTNTALTDDHVPIIERHNRTLKERFRTIFQRMPYAAIPRVMTRHLAMRCTESLNFFPAPNGISNYLSPHTILNRRKIAYKQHLQYEFGSYVQVNNRAEPTNTNNSRTLDAIYLRPTGTVQPGHHVMDLSTGKEIVRSVVTVIPITKTVVDRVEHMGYAQGFSKLEFKNRKNQHFPDTDLAGVVDDDEEEDDENDDHENDSDGNDEESEDDDSDKDDDPDDPQDNTIDPETKAEILDDEHDDDDVPELMQSGDDSDDDDDDANNDKGESDTDDAPSAGVRRSSRTKSQAKSLNIGSTKGQVYNQKRVRFSDQVDAIHNLSSEKHPNPKLDNEYTVDLAIVIARFIHEIRGKYQRKDKKFMSHAQQYMVKEGLRKFGVKGAQAARKELEQMHRRQCFAPVFVSELTPEEKKRAQKALMFLTQKRDNSIKARLVYNGKPTRSFVSREDAASPTVALESILLTGVVEAVEDRDILSGDIPNAFIQASMPKLKKGEHRVIMKIQGVLVDLLVEIEPATYSGAVVFETGVKTVYVEVLMAIYGQLVSALLWYQTFRRDLEKQGFKFNDYDKCVCNRIIRGSQQTVIFHVDDLKSSHKLRKVNDEFLAWLQKKYGGYKPVTYTRGKKHEYLGMTLDYSTKGELRVDMTKYVANMIDDFPDKIKGTASTPAGEDLFGQHGKESPKLDKNRAESFHTTVAQGLFVCKRARPDIQPPVAYLCTRVQEPKESDWAKLIRMLKYLNGTRDQILRLSADNLHIIKWWVDASFATHSDYRSHTGAVMSMGKGAIMSMSRKQKLNTRSSTESELVGADDASTMILWTKLFMEAQGYNIEKNILYQDNKSAILLETNGRRSAGKRSRALNVRYYFLTDQINKGNLSVEYCNTDSMIGDYMSKPLQGAKFNKFRSQIMGTSESS